VQHQCSDQTTGWKTAILNLIPEIGFFLSCAMSRTHLASSPTGKGNYIPGSKAAGVLELSQTCADMPQHFGQGSEHSPAFHFMVQSDLFLFQILISSFPWHSSVILIHTVESVSLLFYDNPIQIVHPVSFELAVFSVLSWYLRSYSSSSLI
jgi:hypothetical protein